MGYTVGSLFSGVGGLDLAAHWAGFETKWFVEKEPFCQKVLAKHWPNTPIHSDVFQCHNLEHVSILVGGFPCQPFSVAGNRKGADDERYLLPEMLRIIREVKPYAVLFENVPGFPSLNDGAEFKYLLRALAEMGFNAEWGHLRASDSGAPHQRERWFLVAYAKSTNDERNPRTMGHAQTQAGKQNVWPVPSGSSSDVVNTECGGGGTRTQRDARRTHQNQEWNNSPSQSRRIAEQFGIAITGQGMGNTDSKRLEGQRARRKSVMGTRHRKAQLKSASHGAGQSRAIESRFRGTLDGLPRWMDFPGWPARPGEDQHTYEPSRVTSAKTPDRAARLKALGNAVVPQVAYPLFEAIHEWLTTQDAEIAA